MTQMIEDKPHIKSQIQEAFSQSLWKSADLLKHKDKEEPIGESLDGTLLESGYAVHLSSGLHLVEYTVRIRNVTKGGK